MTYIELLLEKENIQKVREYLLGSNVTLGITEECYEQRISSANSRFNEIMVKYDFGEDSEMVMAMKEILAVYQNVMEEVGVQAGFYLARHLLESEEFGGNEG